MASLAVAPTPGNINTSIGALGTSGAGAFNQGQSSVQSGLNGVGGISQWYQNLLNGGPQAQAELAPQTANINAGFNQQQQQQAQLYGRGGGRASTMAQIPFQKESAIAGLQQSLLPAAASGATQAAGLEASTGLGESQLGQGGLQAALQGNLQQRGLGLQERGQDIGLGMGLLNALL